MENASVGHDHFTPTYFVQGVYEEHITLYTFCAIEKVVLSLLGISAIFFGAILTCATSTTTIVISALPLIAFTLAEFVVLYFSHRAKNVIQTNNRLLEQYHIAQVAVNSSAQQCRDCISSKNDKDIVLYLDAFEERASHIANLLQTALHATDDENQKEQIRNEIVRIAAKSALLKFDAKNLVALHHKKCGHLDMLAPGLT